MTVLWSVVGVMLGLAGVAVALMGLLAVVDGFTRRGAVSLFTGLACLAVGLYLLGLLG
jgi:hypothetical protein